MKYKLLGLEYLTREKKQWFTEALQERLAMFAHFLSVKGGKVLDVDNVDIIFTHALPENGLEISQMIGNYSGIVPEEVLLSQVPFITNPVEAAEKMKTQREEAVKTQAAAFNVPVYNPDGDGD